MDNQPTANIGPITVPQKAVIQPILITTTRSVRNSNIFIPNKQIKYYKYQLNSAIHIQ